MSWFPIPESLLFENEKWRSLTTTSKVMMLGWMSECNLRPENSFYRSHFDWCARLKTSFSTVKRAQWALKELGWIQVKPGYRNERGYGVASVYEVLVDTRP